MKSGSGDKKKSRSNRKNSWVMLAESGGYTPLPGEQTLYQSPPRTTLSLQTSHNRPPSESYSQQCKSGIVYLTNRRIIYLPVSPTPALQSFAVPILNVADSRVTAPWFGANKWEALIQPVSGGGIPSQHTELDMVMEFKEGGAFDFASIFERLKERLRQAVDVARESGAGGMEDGARGINMNNVHLEDLPAYEESGQHTRVADAQQPSSPITDRRSSGAGAGGPVVAAPAPTSPQRSSPMVSPQRGNFPPPSEPPSEPPPGYEEVQRNSIVDELERQARRLSHD
ncbi:WW-domain ligand protein-domain-containing protein [Paraphoma chrysanthemicola]|uniref:WW-domain ligand protein-domain-containing protein n=1 Tax=Paraphoma chrysanthemicola TaxID=798071 RepID=A0A8K0RHA3_9PLEO|nr:WW-domain ligand protein-domain-containing protein [Paraphoma chrysanthemicola]